MLVESCKSEDWLAYTQNLKGDLAPPKEKDVLNSIMQNKVVFLHLFNCIANFYWLLNLIMQNKLKRRRNMNLKL